MYSISLLKIHTTHLNMQKSKMFSSKEACLVLLTPGFRNLSPSEPFFRTHLFMCHGTSEILRSRSEKKKKIINLDKCTSDGTWAQATAGPGTITSFPQTPMEALTIQQPDRDKARESWGGWVAWAAGIGTRINWNCSGHISIWRRGLSIFTT